MAEIEPLVLCLHYTFCGTQNLYQNKRGLWRLLLVALVVTP